MALNGLLYGTTHNGASLRGNVYSITLAGQVSTVYTFYGATDGSYPEGLVAADGKLFGTAQYAAGYVDKGMLYVVKPSGQVTILHAFSGGSDGAEPGPNLLFSNGLIYGVTTIGGACASACGTIFTVPASAG